MSAEWLAISNALAEATEKIGAFAVAVHTEARGSSSGVIWRPGAVVTAEHALRRDEDIQLTLADGRRGASKVGGTRSVDRSCGAEVRRRLHRGAARKLGRTEAGERDARGWPHARQRTRCGAGICQPGSEGTAHLGRHAIGAVCASRRGVCSERELVARWSMATDALSASPHRSSRPAARWLCR